ncbi:MAG: hypothetical protein H0W47_16690 [Polaromonas sp.]|uniref:hypothetical protein n=1 Tax=Polaromonas sp. TaxID=1869339 RepID=UPI00181014C7|nr:hypothetical protein [Polaromonas sp.]MBA3595405.1 hypothetical protein [Polaromonas sp.]
MFASPLQALQSAWRPATAGVAVKPGLLIAGATGALGSEVLRRLAGSGRFARTQVLAREPMSTALAQVAIVPAGGDDIATWPLCPVPVHTGVVMFEPPRLYHDRERALWTPEPDQLLALAQWFRRCGAQTLVVVLPHAQGSLPQALRQGLASIDEQSVAALGFERVLLVRSAQKPKAQAGRPALENLAAWMLSVLSYMIPASSMPVRPTRLAEFVEAALRVLPPGTHVAAPELLWRAGQAVDMQGVIKAWLNTDASKAVQNTYSSE